MCLRIAVGFVEVDAESVWEAPVCSWRQSRLGQRMVRSNGLGARVVHISTALWTKRAFEPWHGRCSGALRVAVHYRVAVGVVEYACQVTSSRELQGGEEAL